jgi:hypothetical protein
MGVQKKSRPPKKLSPTEFDEAAKRRSVVIQGTTEHRWVNTGKPKSYECEVCHTPFIRAKKTEPFPTTPCVPPAAPVPAPKKFKLHKQLVEVRVPNTGYLFLEPKKGIKPENLTIEARVQMAERANSLVGKLPQYFDRRAIERVQEEAAKREEERKNKARDRIRKFKEERGEEPGAGPKLPRIDGGVPLKKICAEINMDPKMARRILRSKGGKPSGRWEWPADKAKEIIALLKDAIESKESAKAIEATDTNARAQQSAAAAVPLSPRKKGKKS